MVAFNVKKTVQKVTEKIYQQTGESLGIGGEVELKPGFSPRITATDISFGESSVKKMVITLEFARLIKGEIRVKHLLLEDGDIVVQRDENGRWIPDFHKGENREKDRGSDETDSSAGFAPKEVTMENCRLLYMDRKTRTGVDISANRLKASAGRAENRPWNVDVSSRRMELSSFDTGTDDEAAPMAAPVCPETPEHILLPGRADIAVRLDIADLVLNGTGLRGFRANLAVRDGKPNGTVTFAKKHTDIAAIMTLLAEKPLQGENLCASVRQAVREAADAAR